MKGLISLRFFTSVAFKFSTTPYFFLNISLPSYGHYLPFLLYSVVSTKKALVTLQSCLPPCVVSWSLNHILKRFCCRKITPQKALSFTVLMWSTVYNMLCVLFCLMYFARIYIQLVDILLCSYTPVKHSPYRVIWFCDNSFWFFAMYCKYMYTICTYEQASHKTHNTSIWD